MSKLFDIKSSHSLNERRNNNTKSFMYSIYRVIQLLLEIEYVEGVGANPTR